MGEAESKLRESVLFKAQTIKYTHKSRLEINREVRSVLLTQREVARWRRNVQGVALDLRILINPPFSVVDRITDSLYLTGMAGLTRENIISLKVTCIINVTYEMPMLKILGVETFRVPVDDDPEDDMFIYFDDVGHKIDAVSRAGGRTLIHCMAGASRSATLTLAYLIKHQNYDLRSAFTYLKSMRVCARPNMGFFKQLVWYEKHVRGQNSTQILIKKMKDLTKKDTTTFIRVPDFYQSQYPDLYQIEVDKQMQKPDKALQGIAGYTNKNYFNRNRNYKEMQKDMEKMHLDAQEMSGREGSTKTKKSKHS